MGKTYTEEELNKLDKAELVRIVLSVQEQLEGLDHKMQLLLEGMADLKRRRFGRSSEKHEVDGQLVFREEEGEWGFFNEAEAVADNSASQQDEAGEESVLMRKRPKKKAGKRMEDIKDLPIEVIEHTMSDEELSAMFGEGGFKRLPDEVYRRYSFTPAKVAVEEHHVAVYAGKEDESVVKAKHPAYLLRNSMASASIEAAVINAKYVNAIPLYRQEKEFERYGLSIPRQAMANWTIRCADRYLSLLYDYLHEKICNYHVLQADETPVLVNKDGRPAGSKSYMWVYRTGQMYERQVVLYEYQKTRNASHPREFLKGFSGICVTDGYQVYHAIAGEREDLRIAGCWAHARRRYDEAVKALPKSSRKGSRADMALGMIQKIYREEKALKGLSSDERLDRRRRDILPMVEAYFAWVRENIGKVPRKGKTWEGMEYSLNQEKYLKVFLEDGEVPMDNNAAEQSIRGFCIGKKNWVMIDTLSGAEASAIIYSIAETAKANNLKPYEYFKHLLTEIPEHMEDTDCSFLEDLLPWSPNLPDECRKPNKE